jgi:hypothetical protein
MRKINTRKLLILIILVSFSPFVYSQERTIPLDMYLIVDGSQSFQNAKNDAVAWLNSQVIDRILMEGDTISIWSAGESSGIIHSGQVTGEKTDIKDKLQTLKTDGKTADFSGALREAASRVSQTPQSRLSYTMLVTASAEGLEAALTGSSQGLLRWSRSERYERWQVLIVAPDIAPRVRDATASYMNAQNPRP